MKSLAASATVAVAAIAAFLLVLAGKNLLPSAVDLLPIPRVSQGKTQVVVVDTGRSPAAGSRSNPTPAEGDSGAEILANAGSAGVATVPVPSSTPADVPVLLSARAGYVRHGRVVLSLGWLEHAGTSMSVQRRRAPLSSGTCGAFGAWETVSASDQLPQGSCAIYRVLVDGTVAFQLPEIVRYDGTPPTAPALTVAETGAREYVAGSTLYVASGADDPRPVTVSADTSDPESGLSAVSFANGGEPVQVKTAPWQTELTPSPGSISVTAVNEPGGSATSSFDVVADGNGPAGGSISYPTEPGPDGTIAIDVSAGADAGSGVDASSGVVERRVALFSGDGCGDFGDWRAVSTADTPPVGRCLQYRYRVSDKVGNETVYGSSVVARVSDSTAPSTSIVSPAGGARLSGPVNVVAEAADDGSGIQSVAIQVRSTRDDDWTTLATLTAAPYTTSWDSSDLRPGCYLLRSVATDRSGNTTESDPVAVTVVADTTAPSTAIVTPSGGTHLTGATTVQAQAADAESGLRSVTIQVRRHCGGWTDLATFSAGPFVATWDTSQLEPGRYQLRSRATDRRGNTASSAPVTVTVDAVEEEPEHHEETSTPQGPPEDESVAVEAAAASASAGDDETEEASGKPGDKSAAANTAPSTETDGDQGQPEQMRQSSASGDDDSAEDEAADDEAASKSQAPSQDAGGFNSTTG